MVVSRLERKKDVFPIVRVKGMKARSEDMGFVGASCLTPIPKPESIWEALRGQNQVYILTQGSGYYCLASSRSRDLWLQKHQYRCETS
eukprot:m.236531 g.236531  ORF g.236531 m.236531 type:complete len:88 (+) comp33687_c0_seq1:1511-1774(+)